MARHEHRRWERLSGAALALAVLLGAAAAGAQAPNPVEAQVLRKTRVDAQALAAIRERTRALVESLQQEPGTGERALEGTVHRIRGDTLYLRTGSADAPLIVPLKLQPSTRVIGRTPPPRRPAGSPAQALRLQLKEGDPVRARFTVSEQPQGAVNLVTRVQAAPAPPPTPPPAQR